MKKLKLLLKTLFVIAVILIVPFSIFTVITERTDLIPQMKSFTVLTGSMEPKVHVGSIVYTSLPSSYRKGDIITYRRNETNITHRIIALSSLHGRTMYQTKGDANNALDFPLVSKSDMVGKVFLILPYVGRFSVFLKTFFGFMLFIALPLIAFIILELLTIKKELEKEIEKKILQKHALQ